MHMKAETFNLEEHIKYKTQIYLATKYTNDALHLTRIYSWKFVKFVANHILFLGVLTKETPIFKAGLLMYRPRPV